MRSVGSGIEVYLCSMQFSTIFIDLDGTVYPHENGMWEEIASRMEAYMQDVLGIPKPQIPALRQKYFLTYGTTLRGLQANFKIDAEEYLAYVHDIPVNHYIKPDLKLKTMLASLPQKKWILTNSDRNHATRVLKALGCFTSFEGILGVQEFDFNPKPQPFVFRKALEFAANPEIEECIFIDDIPQNLIPAKKMGFTTVLVGNKQPDENSDYHIPKIYDLPVVVPNLNASPKNIQ